jgi:perosamine synthetase
MVVTNADSFNVALRQFRNHGINSDHHRRAIEGNLIYDMQSLGFNFRLSDVHAALGLSQLEKLPQWTARRQEIADRYRARLGAISWAEPLEVTSDSTHGNHLFVVRWKPNEANIDRDKALAMLRIRGIQANIHYRPVYQHSFYKEHLREQPASICPNAERAFLELISLPIFPAMTGDDVNRVCDALEEIGGGTVKATGAGETSSSRAA